MESRGGSSTKPGVLVWTPAPECPPSPGPEEEELGWEEAGFGDEEFQSHMDGNGIIGLAEGGGGSLLRSALDPGTPDPEVAPPADLEELSYNLSDLLCSEPLSPPPSPSQCVGEEPAPKGEGRVDAQAWLEDEGWGSRRGCAWQDGTEVLSGHSWKEAQNSCHDDESSEPEPDLLTPELRGHAQVGDTEELRTGRDVTSPSSHHFLHPSFHPPIPLRQRQLPPAELLGHAGIEGKALPVPVFSDNQPESRCSRLSHTSMTQWPIESGWEEPKPQTPPLPGSSPLEPHAACRGTSRGGGAERNLDQSVDLSGGRIHSPAHSGPHAERDRHSVQSSPRPHPSPDPCGPSAESPPLSTPQQRRGRPQHSRCLHSDTRHGQLTHPLPDFSQVRPRIRFPRSCYKPPPRRRAAPGRPVSGGAALAPKSPAEMVRQVLLSCTGRSEAPRAAGAPPADPRVEETCCPIQASALVDQLQEDYNRLLTKHAEAENTIDRLRLEAKVGLYSDPPKPSHFAVAGVLQEGSKVMTLTFPQAQRAEVSSAGLGSSPPQPAPVGSGSWLAWRLADDLTALLSQQAEQQQRQVGSFEELLRRGSLQPAERTQGLSSLAQGQDSLERSYLSAWQQHLLLQQQGGEGTPFDPDRELEGRVFHAGLRLDELREWVEQMEHNWPSAEPPPTPASTLPPPSLPVEEAEPHPEKPLSAVCAEGGVGVQLEVSSISGESDGEEEEEEQHRLPSALPRPLKQKHQRVEKKFNLLLHQYQNVKKLPGVLQDGSGDTVSAVPGNDGMGGDQLWRGRDGRITSSTGHRLSAVPQASPPGLFVSPVLWNSMETLPEALRQAPALPRERDGRSTGGRGAKSLSSSVMSLGAAYEARPRPAPNCGFTAPSLDGVISPETDSGFVGSESSRHHPAVPRPDQQRATVRQSVPQDVGAVSTAMAPPAHPPRRRGERVSPQTCPPETHAPLGPTPLPTSPSPLSTGRSLGPSLSEENQGQSDQDSQVANQELRNQKYPSPGTTYRHSDHLKAQRSTLLTNQHAAIQSLQEEVNKLREELEGSLRQASPVRAPSAALEDSRRHTRPCTSTPLRPAPRSAERGRHRGREREGGRSGEEEQEGGAARVPRPRRPASDPRPPPQANDGPPHASADGCGGGQDTEPSRTPVLRCPHCLSDYDGTSGRPMRRDSATRPAHSSRLCPLCDAPEPVILESEDHGSAPRRNRQMSYRHMEGRGMFSVAPPPGVLGSVPVLQCVPMCQSLLFLPSPVPVPSPPLARYLSCGTERGSGLRGQLRARRSLSVDDLLLSRSLDRALATASRMKEASHRIASSLTSGLQHSLLTHTHTHTTDY